MCECFPTSEFYIFGVPFPIMGHKTLAIIARYSHLSPGHRRDALERLADGRAALVLESSRAEALLCIR